MRFFFVFRRIFPFFGEKSTMRDVYIYATHSTFGWFTGSHIILCNRALFRTSKKKRFPLPEKPTMKSVWLKKTESEKIGKPSSVVYGHLSTLAVAGKVKRYSRRTSGGQPYATDAQSCSEWGLHGTPRYRSVGELLPRLSTRTETRFCGLFLLHFPWSRLHLTLSGTLSCAARTFLTALSRPATV